MTPSDALTALLALGLMALALAFLHRELSGAESPPGDRWRRLRRTAGAVLLAVLAIGLGGWQLIDPKGAPVLFMNVSAALLVLVWALLLLGLYDMTAVARAERHRRLAILAQELYGVDLKELSGKEAEAIGREALAKLAHGLRQARKGEAK